MTEPAPPIRTIEVRYVSMNHTHMQVEFTDESGFLEECWIPLSAITSGFNVFDDIMDIDVLESVLDEIGIPYE